MPVPRIRPRDRLEIDHLGYKDDRITFVRAKHGYAEEYDVPELVRQIAKAGVECPVDAARCLLLPLQGGAHAPATGPGMSQWRKRLFLAHGADRRRAGRLLQAAARAHDHARLRDRVLRVRYRLTTST